MITKVEHDKSHPSIYANKFNKKAVLSIHTADICRRVVLRWRKTLVFSIKHKTLTISVIDFFNESKNTNQFQEAPILGSKPTVSYR